MVDHAAASRAEAIRGFAADLRELRASAGSPSFREMSGRSHAISHTTLHEAAQGNRFPSWSTTVEFVKACGADPADYRERWEKAQRSARASGGAVNPVPDSPAPDSTAPEGAASDSEASDGPASDHVAVPEDAPSTPAWRRFRFPLLAGAAAVVVAAGVVTTLAVTGEDPSSPGGAAPSARVLTAADCPVRQKNPPAADPRHAGDADLFLGDITVPDCTHVPGGTSVRKVWRFENTGTVHWRGYMLHRKDQPQRRTDCQTISDIPIPDTPAGAKVDVNVEVATPRKPGFCFVRFVIEDASGHVAFPAKRPVNFQIIVD